MSPDSGMVFLLVCCWVGLIGAVLMWAWDEWHSLRRDRLVELQFSRMIRGARAFRVRVPRVTEAAVVEAVRERLYYPGRRVYVDWNERGTAGVIYLEPMTRIGVVRVC